MRKRILPSVLSVAILGLILVLAAQSARAQDVEEFYAKMLEKEVEVVDPVKRPEIGLNVGIINFFGDINYPSDNAILGSWAVGGSVSSLFGPSRQIRAGLNVLYGLIEGQDFSRSLVMNENHIELNDEQWYTSSAFQTEYIEATATVEYNFWHLLGKRKTLRPYIAGGVGFALLTTKGNYKNEEGKYYHYWPDGTTRLRAFAPGLSDADAPPVQLDRNYETDISRINPFELKKIPAVAAVFPVEVGVDIYVSERVYLRLFSSFRYCLSDLLDGYDKTVADRFGLEENGRHDLLMYSGLSFHLDFFSQKDAYIMDQAFADIKDFDYDVFLADQDHDGVLDHMDDCPDTPKGVPVDSVGCPVDFDMDGVPDYRDKQLDTPDGLSVDEDGIALSDKDMILPKDVHPVSRDRVKLMTPSKVWNKTYTFQGREIPERFKAVDVDGDGYISYDEVIRAVDDYFVGKSSYTPDDIYELNAFFFAQ